MICQAQRPGFVGDDTISDAAINGGIEVIAGQYYDSATGGHNTFNDNP